MTSTHFPRFAASGFGGKVARAAALGAALLIAGALPAGAETIEVYSSGSLRPFLPASVVKDAGLPEGTQVKATFGGGGLLRERLEKGEHADIYMSASTLGPRALVESGNALIGPIPLARNHMCLIAQRGLGVTPVNLLDKMLEPKVRISTSTPIADPGGDYSYEIFDNAEALRPGATKILKDKALHFSGDPTQPPPEPGHTATGSLFLRDKIDMTVSYCSNASALVKEIPSLISLPFPKSLDPAPISGIAVLTTKQIAWKLVLFLLSEKGQKLGTDAGFEPIAKKLDEPAGP